MAEKSPDTRGEAPWAAKREPGGRHLIRRLLPWLGAAALLALIVWGLWPKPVAVETGNVARAPLTVHVSEEGKTRIRNRYIVAAPVAGNMRRVTLKPGDPVEAGVTLLTAIDPSPAPLLDPRARVQAEAVVSQIEASRKRASESLAAARAALTLADADRERVRSVRKDGTISDSDRDRIEANATIKAAEVRAAEFSLLVIDYELAQARAALERPDATGAPVEIKSPVSGRVLHVMQESETVVTPGMGILEIGDPSDLEIEAEILSRDAVAIRPGDPVEIDHWGGDQPLKARVRRVEPAAFTKISALGVEEQRVIVLCDLIDPPESARALGDRFRVEVRVAVWEDDDVLVAPAGALFRRGNAWHTFVYRNGRAKLAAIEAGRTDGRLTQILGGLEKNDLLLLHPPDTVKDGTRVIARDE